MNAPVNRKTAEISEQKTRYGTFLPAQLARYFRAPRAEAAMIDETAVTEDRFARTVFLVAGIYGLIVLLPGVFSEKILAEKMPPAITHPEFYYGFLGVAIAWQVAFLIISRDPQRFRPIIPAAILEKLTYSVACAMPVMLGRIPVIVALGGAGDFILGIFFTVSYFKLKPAQAAL